MPFITEKETRNLVATPKKHLIKLKYSYVSIFGLDTPAVRVLVHNEFEWKSKWLKSPRPRTRELS